MHFERLCRLSEISMILTCYVKLEIIDFVNANNMIVTAVLKISI